MLYSLKNISQYCAHLNTGVGNVEVTYAFTVKWVEDKRGKSCKDLTQEVTSPLL